MFAFGHKKALTVSDFDDEEFGTVHVRQHPRASRMKLVIEPEGLRATLPYGVGVEALKRFIDARRPAIRRKRQTVRNRSVLVIDERHPLRTYTFTTAFRSEDIHFLRFRLAESTLTISYPTGRDLTTADMQEKIKAGIKHFLRQEAKRVLPSRLDTLARRWGFDYNDVKIRNSQTRWGSCSASKNINLSFYLMLLPTEELIDSVLLHELCHTVHMNHSSEFWQLMRKVTDGQSDRLRREIKRYRCTL